MSYFHFLCVFLSTFTQSIYQYSEGVDTVSMSDFDNDGLATEGGFKRKYEALLKDHLELKEQEKKKGKILESLENKLEERVRCPVCLEVPTSCPMYSCANGHLVCATCYQGSNSSCSLCRTKMAKTVSLLARTVIENIGHRCKFEADGCEVRTPLSKVDEHNKNCDFRPVDCPSYLCGEKVAYQKVVDHILNQCKQAMKKTDVGTEDIARVKFNIPIANFGNVKFAVLPIKRGEQLFFLSLKNENEHFKKFYVQMWGTKEDCKKFKVEIKLEDERGKDAITFCDHPLPVDISEEDLVVEGVQVSNAFMKRNICTPMVDNLEQVSLSLKITFAAVEDSD